MCDPVCRAVFAQMWPKFAAYMTKQAHPQLDPLLKQSKPAWIKDVKLTKCDTISYSVWKLFSNRLPQQTAA